MARSIWLFLVMVSVTAASSTNVFTPKKVESFHLKSDIHLRFATTQISSAIRNLENKIQVADFTVAMPKDAFIVAFYMTIDGERYNGQVKERQTAEREKQATQSKGEKTVTTPRNANIFKVSIDVSAGSLVNFSLTYQEKLHKSHGFYEYEVYINPGQAVPDFLVDVSIRENRPLRFVQTPALRTDDLLTSRFDESGREKMNEMTTVIIKTPKTATIQYMPSKDQQGNGGRGISARFVVQYDVEHERLGGDVLVVDRYFAHFIGTDFVTSILPKDIIFVLDKSSSMSGKKIRQLKDAMYTILSNLLPQDRFNIITFSSSARKRFTGLVEAQQKRVSQAKSYVKKTYSNGGTNINDVLLDAVSDLTEQQNDERVRMIFFISDGEPTEGEKDPEKIAHNVFNANDGTVAIYCLGFGKGADMSLLQTISAQNSGFTKKIFEDTDAALQVSSIYKEISTVTFKRLRIKYDVNTVDVATLTQTDFTSVFNGTEISVYGLLKEGTQTVKYEITGLEESGETVIAAEVDDIDTVVLDAEKRNNPLLTETQDRPGIIERMWAFKTITESLSEIDKYKVDINKTEDLLEDVFLMSLKYNFVTPLTSMVVGTPGQGVVEVRQANVEGEVFDFSIFNFTAPPTTTTATPPRTTTVMSTDIVKSPPTVAMVTQTTTVTTTDLVKSPSTTAMVTQTTTMMTTDIVKSPSTTKKVTPTITVRTTDVKSPLTTTTVTPITTVTTTDIFKSPQTTTTVTPMTMVTITDIVKSPSTTTTVTPTTTITTTDIVKSPSTTATVMPMTTVTTTDVKSPPTTTTVMTTDVKLPPTTTTVTTTDIVKTPPTTTTVTTTDIVKSSSTTTTVTPTTTVTTTDIVKSPSTTATVMPTTTVTTTDFVQSTQKSGAATASVHVQTCAVASLMILCVLSLQLLQAKLF
ncbi:inter-alpha-trypsin inhibitor heavy chain h3 [Plakobranchus ocellatus]|uniref:Inter-alpha-trypsin inhibitor heavy chain h3 n=1 Tax=Plakobranchus ocellatus TaxID=259542 RepID=A0AAV3ZZ68_9GAST|nr:inter-alpha-trypsin inhibitor heavy chain h3 [Plakobranchus ocellatus]